MPRGALLVVVVLTLTAGGCLQSDGAQVGPDPDTGTDTASTPTAASPLGGTLSVHYLDVGQADATVLEFPTGETMLIDSGDWRQDGEDVLAFLEERGIERLDHLVGTHPHADHIGGHEAVIDHFETEGDGVGAAYDSGVAHTSGTFEEYLDAIERHDVDLFTVTAGDEVTIGNATVTVVNPPADSESDEMHPNSVSLVVTYGESSFLFTGDLEAPGEERLVAERSADVDADVSKAGHHGSATSSSPSFLDGVTPHVVVISSALDSQYGHPHNETLDLFAERGDETYWTAVHGDVTMESDGTSLSIETEHDGPTDPTALREAKNEAVPASLRSPVGYMEGVRS